MIALDMPPAPQQQLVEVVLLHDARAVHDTARIRLKDFANDGQPTWVVAKMTPGPRSGSATIPGAAINAQTGALVVPENARPVLVKEGSWLRRAAFPPDVVPAGNTYAWSEPLNQPKRRLEAEDYYSPFIHGGIVLFRPAAGRNGLDWFGPIYLLLSDWDREVVATLALSTHDRSLIENETPDPAKVSHLAGLMASDNPLSATIAFRSLASSGNISPELAGKQLTRADHHLAAIFSYLSLVAPDNKEGDALVEGVRDSIQAAREVEPIRQVSLGAFSASLFQSNDRVITARARSVLIASRQRLAQLGVTLTNERTLALIFEKQEVP